MLFSSLEFLVLFLPLTLIVALRLRGQALLRWIVLTSVIFYAFAAHWWFVIPMLATTTVDYWVAILIERERRAGPRKWLLALSLAGNLGMLAFFSRCLSPLRGAGVLRRASPEAGVPRADLRAPRVLRGRRRRGAPRSRRVLDGCGSFPARRARADP